MIKQCNRDCAVIWFFNRMRQLMTFRASIFLGSERVISHVCLFRYRLFKGLIQLILSHTGKGSGNILFYSCPNQTIAIQKEHYPITSNCHKKTTKTKNKRRRTINRCSRTSSPYTYLAIRSTDLPTRWRLTPSTFPPSPFFNLPSSERWFTVCRIHK